MNSTKLVTFLLWSKNAEDMPILIDVKTEKIPSYNSLSTKIVYWVSEQRCRGRVIYF